MCGIIAILASPTVVFGIILGIVAIILAVLAKKQSRDGKATAGMVCGIIGAVLSLILVAAGAALVNEAMQDPEFQELIESDGGDGSGDVDVSTPEDTSEDGTPDDGTDGADGADGADGTDAAGPVADRIVGTWVTDDAVSRIQITDMSIDDDGDLRVDFFIENHTEGEITLISDPGTFFRINGEDALCICYTTVEPHGIDNDFFYIPASDVPEGGLDAITDFYGILVVEMPNGDQMDYPLSSR